MEMTGEYRIPAPREKVWAALNDPEVLRATIPGCQSIEKLSDTEMTAKVTTKIGPVKATFTGAVTLSNIDPPRGYTITGEGKGGVAGFAKGGADVSLAEDGSGTILRYTAKAQVGGKLAQIGSRLVDSAAKQMADAFFSAFAARLGGGKAGPSASAMAGEGSAEASASASGEAPGAEATIEDVIRDPVVVAEAVEERAEVAAATGFLGGPTVWGLIAIAVIVAVILILR